MEKRERRNRGRGRASHGYLPRSVPRYLAYVRSTQYVLVSILELVILVSVRWPVARVYLGGWPESGSRTARLGRVLVMLVTGA